jgi:hypothetical protein
MLTYTNKIVSLFEIIMKFSEKRLYINIITLYFREKGFQRRSFRSIYTLPAIRKR